MAVKFLLWVRYSYIWIGESGWLSRCLGLVQKVSGVLSSSSSLTRLICVPFSAGHFLMSLPTDRITPLCAAEFCFSFSAVGLPIGKLMVTGLLCLYCDFISVENRPKPVILHLYCSTSKCSSLLSMRDNGPVRLLIMNSSLLTSLKGMQMVLYSSGGGLIKSNLFSWIVKFPSCSQLWNAIMDSLVLLQAAYMTLPPWLTSLWLSYSACIWLPNLACS